MDMLAHPEREGLHHGSTGICVRAMYGGKWGNYDIAELDLPSLRYWLRSRGGENAWAEAVVEILLGWSTEERNAADIEAGLATELEGGEIIYNGHDPVVCKGHVCVIHNRTDHNMRSFPQHWRDDRKIMERICPHGIGHPDPDEKDYLELVGRDVGVHGCDGCCRA